MLTARIRQTEFFAMQTNGTVVADIVDPHSTHLSDALPKLQGLAEYAATHTHMYRRIETVAKVGDKLRVLDSTIASVREAMAEAKEAQNLYAGSHASDY